MGKSQGRKSSWSGPAHCHARLWDLLLILFPGTVFLSPPHQAKYLAQTVDMLSTDPEISYINPWLSSARTWRYGATVSGISVLLWMESQETLRSLEDCYLAPSGGFLWNCIKLMLALVLRLIALASGVRG